MRPLKFVSVVLSFGAFDVFWTVVILSSEASLEIFSKDENCLKRLKIKMKIFRHFEASASVGVVFSWPS